MNFPTKETNPTAKAPSSISLYQRTGVLRSTMLFISSQSFFLPSFLEESKDELFKTFFLRKWSGAFLSSQLKQGTITKDNIKYHVSFYKCSFLDATQAKNVLISFRAPQEEWNLQAFALVKVLYSRQEPSQGEQEEREAE